MSLTIPANPQPVSGPLTDSELRATAVPVSGPLTDAQLRATAVSVSGTVTASSAATHAEDAAHASGDSGTFVLGVRNDDMAALTGTNGDYSGFAVDEKGRLIFQDKMGQWFERGKLRVVGGNVALGLAGTASFRLANPAASGKPLLVVAAFLASSVAGDATVNKNGTLPGPTSLTPWNPNFAGVDTTVAVAQSDDAAVIGGTNLAASIRVPADVTRPVTIPILLTPGSALNFSIALTTGGTVHCNVVYIEGP